MKKPTFDPSLPYSVLGATDKPAFDPSKEFTPLTEETSELESLARGLASGASFGYADELTGAAESLLTDKTYEEARDESRQAYRQAREDNPISYGVGEIGAGIGTAFIPGLGALNAAKGAGMATKIGLGALQGGISASGLSEGENAQEILKDTAIGAGIGGALPIAIKGAGIAANKINSGAKKTLQKLSGVDATEYSKLVPATMARIQGFSEPDISKIVDYADNPDLYKNTKSIEAIKQNIDTVNLENKIYMDRFSDGVKASKVNLQNEISDYKQTLRNAAQDFIDASSTLERQYKGTTPPQEVYDDVLNSVTNLRKAVSEGSSAAFEVLDSEKVVVPKNEILGAFKETLNKLKIDDNAPVGSVAVKDFNALASQVDRFAEYPEEIKGSALKRIIQDLDNELEYAESLGDISSRANAAKKSLRHNLDQMLKVRSKNYDQFMADVQMDSKLLQKANRLYGTEDKVLQKINNLSLDANNTNLETLGELNPQAKNKLYAYLQAKHNLNPENFRKQQAQLSEFQNLNPLDQESFQKNNRLLNNSERQALIDERFTNKLDSQKFLEEQFEKQNVSFKGEYIPPSQTEGLVNSYLKPSGPRIEPSKKLRNLTHFENGRVGPEIEEDLRRTAVANVFDRSTTNGSRNTLMGASVLGGAGTAIGGPIGGAIGAGIGGAGGYFSDKITGIFLKGGIDTVHALKQYAPRLGKFAQPLIKAAERGNTSLAATVFILQQSNSEFRQTLKQLEDEENQ